MIAWNMAYRGRFDSPWCVAQKLVWLNTSRVNEILAKIVGRAKPFRESYGTNSFVDLEWLPRAPTDADGRFATREVSDVLTALAPRWVRAFLNMARLLMSEDLRLCPSCIRLGYHSVVHQMAGLERCPIHGDQLIDACPICGRYFGVYNIRHAYGFTCVCCGNSLLADGYLGVFPDTLKVAEKRRIAPILDWIRKISPCIPSCRPNMVLGTRQGNRYILVPLEKAILTLLATIIPIPFGNKLLCGSVQGLELHAPPKASWKTCELISLTGRNPVDYCARVHNEVTSEVKKSLGKHMSCFRKGAYVVRGDNPDHLAFHSGFCVRAYAYGLWTLRTDMLMDQLREFARPTKPHVRLDIDDLRSRLLSEYFYCLHITDVLHELHAQGNFDAVRNALSLGALRGLPGPWLNIVKVELQEKLDNPKPSHRLMFTSKSVNRRYYCDHGSAVDAHVERLLQIADKVAQKFEH